MSGGARAILDRLDQRPEDWRKTVLALYNAGASDREVMVELELTRGQWETLMGDLVESDFAEVVEYGRLVAHAWWERLGRTRLNDKTFNTALWTIQMKNRFGWSEKTEQSMTNIDLTNQDSDSIQREISRLLARYHEGRGKSVVDD